MGLSEPLKMGLYEHCSIKQISDVNIYNIILKYYNINIIIILILL